jgi:hypothetical protein
MCPFVYTGEGGCNPIAAGLDQRPMSFEALLRKAPQDEEFR